MHKTVAVMLFGVVLVGAGLLGGRARADIAPPDKCTAPGQPCNNGGPTYNQAGTCTATTCTKSVPGPDGGFMSMTYDCNLCKVAGGTGGAAGSGGASGSGGSGAGTGGAGTDAGTTPPSKDSGCAVAGAAAVGWPALALAGVLGLLFARRRRS